MKNTKKIFTWLKKLFEISKTYIFLNTLEIPLAIAISLLGAYFPSRVVADVTGNVSTNVFITDTVFFGGILGVLIILNVLIPDIRRNFDESIRHKLSSKIIGVALDASYGKTENSEFQNKFWRMENYSYWNQRLSKEFLQKLKNLIIAAIGMVMYLCMLSNMAPVLFIVVALGTIINFWSGKRTNKWDVEHRDLWLNLDYKTAYISNEFGDFENAKDVHLYHMVPWLSNIYDGYVKQRLKYTFLMQLNYWVNNGVSAFTDLLWEIVAYIYLIYKVCNGNMDAAGFVFYFAIITEFASWCRNIANTVRELNENLSYIDEYNEFEVQMGVKEDKNKEKLNLPLNHVPEIVFEHVSFRYEGADTDTLNDISVRIAPGENIAMVGENGAGKTTFIKLLCGFYEPTKGRILIDGMDASRFSLDSRLEYFTAIFQDKSMFPFTVKENIVMGLGTDDKKYDDALNIADFKEKIKNLPQGENSHLMKGAFDDAIELSGGEEQKLLLARALCKDATFMILDEPTAALDPITESELYEKYNEFSKNKSSIFISHRLASTKFCNRILLMENGKIKEEGTHDELMKLNGEYANMFNTQAQFYKSDSKKNNEEMAV